LWNMRKGRGPFANRGFPEQKREFTRKRSGQNVLGKKKKKIVPTLFAIPNVNRKESIPWEGGKRQGPKVVWLPAEWRRGKRRKATFGHPHEEIRSRGEGRKKGIILSLRATILEGGRPVSISGSHF